MCNISSSLAVVAVLAAGQARGQATQVRETCLTYDSRYEDAPLMRVRGEVAAGKVHFQAKPEACPAEPNPCSSRRKAYLVPGDVVFVGPELRGFRCAYFGTAKGDLVSGFLPAGALDTTSDGGNLDAKFLSGTWTSLGENPITFAAAGGRAVQARGEATWQGGNGITHEGRFLASAEPTGDSIVLRDEYCEVKMRRRGPYLVVNDNGECGGMNVRFHGIYVKRSR